MILLNNYQVELMQFLLNLVTNDYPLVKANGSKIAHGEYFLETFKKPIFQYMLKNPVKTMEILDGHFIEFPDKIFSLIESLLIFMQHNKISESEMLVDEIFKRCNNFQRLLNDIENRKTKFFNINRIAITLKNKPTEAIKNNDRSSDLYLWILEELVGTTDLEKKTMFLKSFLICLADEESTQVNPELSLVFRQLRDVDSAVWLQKLESDDSLKFQASSCLQALLKGLIITNSSIVYQAVIKFAVGAYKLLFKDDINEYLNPYFASISETNALKSLQIVYKIFMDTNLTNERFEILKYFLLPSMELNKTAVIEKFYEEKCEEMIMYLRKKIDSNLNSVDRKKTIVSKIGCYNMFELMFAKFELKFFEINDSVTKTKKPVNQILIQEILNLRCLSALNEEEKEITRILQCSALNCCISTISLKEEEKYYKFIFVEDRKKDQLIWERIIDCNKKYDFQQAPKMIRKDRKRLINIRKTIKNGQNPFGPSASYFHRYNLISLTLLEDVHAYDLNDTAVLAQAKTNTEKDRRLDLNFENDEFNDHECMPMITGVIMHLFNNEITSLPDLNQQTNNPPPDYFKFFLNGFMTKIDNVRLFLMKIITNTKNAFLPYMKSFFKPITVSITRYLENNSSNYIIRDILIILIESKYEAKENIEKDAAQNLIEHLIKRAPDPNTNVYKYNLEIIESLCKLWSPKYSQNFSMIINWDSHLALQTIVILLRSYNYDSATNLIAQPEIRKLIEDSVEKWKENESRILWIFEAVGWLLRLSNEENFQVIITNLLTHLNRMKQINSERCAQSVCTIFKVCRDKPHICRELFKFANPKDVADNYKAECFELFYHRIPDIEPINLSTELLLIDLESVLNKRILACEESALKIIERLVPLVSESKMRLYLKLVLNYTGATSSLLENRKLAFSILMETYLKYRPPHDFGILSSRTLVRALDDPAEEIQEFVLTFWREKIKLPETCYDRFIFLLDIYDPELQDHFARFLCLMMLDLTYKSLDSNRSMFKPLIDCTFRDYELFVPKRRANLGSMAPLFAPSLASQLSRASQLGLSHQGTFAATLRILATRELEFEPTAQIQSDSSSQFEETAKIPNPSQNKLSKRLTTFPNFKPEIIQKRNEYHKKLQKEVEYRRNNAKFYRKYRIGDFPDVELTQASFVESLRRLIMKDWLACKDLTVLIVRTMIERLEGNERYKDSINKIFNKFEEILQEQREVGHNFTLILLEIILHGFSKKIEMNANSVRKICKATSNYSLGILSLEKNILLEQTITEIVVEEPPNKRQKVESLEKQNWIELAGLYKHQNETDIVNSIFKREGLLNEKAREGALAQAEKNWLKAKNAYEEAYEVALDSEKEYCLEGMFECLAELSSWSQINEKIEIIIDKNYNSVWENPLKKQLLPWIFEAQMQNTLEKYTTSTDLDDDTFISNFKEWIQNSQMMTIKKHFGEEMSVFYLMDDKFEGTARHCLKSCIDHVREQWIRLSPLSESIRISIFSKLRGISNIDNYLSMDKSTDLQNKTTELIQYWDKHLPSENEDLLSWNKHVLYRLNFAFHLYGKLKDFDDESSTLNDIIAAMARQRIKISELAMKNKNNIVAKKHTLETEKLIDNLDSDEFSKLKSEFILAASKYKFICSQIESNVKKRYKYYISSWKIANDILMDTNVDISTKIKAQYHIFDLTLTLQRSEKTNFELLNFLINDDFIASNIEASDDLEILGGLKDYSFNILKSTCGTGNDKEMAESYTRFGKYCYDLVFDGCDRNFYLVKEFISSILNAMSLGSLEAAHYFPCLLKHEYYHDNEEVTELFISLSENVPSWMFLFWQSQIMSYLSKPISRILVSMVKRLIIDYPNGVMYNFRQTYEAQPDLKMKPEIREMHEILFANSKLKTFFEALHYVCQPEYYLRHHLLKALDSIECYVENVDLLLGQLSVFVDQEVKENSLQGLLYKELGKYRSYIEKCKSMEYDTAKQFAKNVADDLYKAMKKRLQNKYQALQLKDYSPYLSNFSGEDFEIEIPGQYSNIKKPLTRYHTKILKFDRFIKVMESKYNPIKINLIGNDSRTYGFLVKFGEDLRQDQRLQQIFEIVNKTLSTDSNCKNRYLSINTYQVVPLSNSLGLIQWVDETRSLKEFIQFTMDNKEIMQTVMNKYQNWINKAGNYKKAVLKYNANDVSSKMNEFINDFEWDYLKKTFMILSPSLECFVSLRRNFITNYATMCIIHWITGVGDRHVENMLIEVKTGKCYGIDFGMAFGTGINQIPPELVPFRLTTQILGLLKPFDKYALFGITMTHVLNAVREEKGPVLACLNVFINEPLNWSKHVNKQTEDNKNNEEYIDVKWSPRNIISIIKKKLEGVKPSMIMLEELDNAFEVNNYEDEYLFKCKHIINGTDCHNLSLRSRMKDFNLTPEEQVQCLLEQATDLNVLGRMWVGWCPFV